MKRHFSSSRIVRDPERLLQFLIERKFGAEGVSTEEGKLHIFLSDDEKRSPQSLLDQYVDQDYYEITADRKGYFSASGDPVFQVKRDGKDILHLTVTKKSGKTGANKPDNENLDFIWHGPSRAHYSGAVLRMVNGVGKLEVGKVYAPGAGLVEILHPDGKAQRAVAFIEFVIVLK